MEYPFKDLMPLDEATAREGYYKDWTHIDADTFHQISELVKFIREKGYGSDTREAIAQALERVYHDAMKSGNADMELSMARKHFKDLASRLNASDDELTSTIAQLAQKTTKGEIGLSDLNKNKLKLDATWFANSFLEDLANGEIDTTYLYDKSVTINKIAFTKVVSQNLFNPDTAVDGMLDYTNGMVVTNSDFVTSDYIAVNEGDVLRTSNNLQTYCFYDLDEKLTYGLNNASTTTVTVPEGVAFIRVSFYYIHLLYFMLVVGKLPNQYDPYRLAIDGNNVFNIKGKDINDNSTPIYKLSGEKGKNLINPQTIIEGKYVDVGGVLFDNPSLSTTDFIEVEPDDNYVITNMRTIARYDGNYNFIPPLLSDVTYPNNYRFETTDNTRYVRASFRTSEKELIQLERGYSATSFEPYGYYIQDLLVKPQTIKPDERVEKVDINLPERVFATVGDEFTIFTSNLLKENVNEYNIKYVSQIGEQTERGFYVIPTEPGSFNLTVEIYNKNRLISTKEVMLVVSEPLSTPTKVLMIGDSTIRTNGEGLVTQRLLDKNPNISLIGTMGSGSNWYEGRGGWTVAQYRTGDSYLDTTNPFYSPSKQDFDFTYYMNQNNYVDVDVVILNLGINDVFHLTSDEAVEAQSTNIIADIEYIVSNIKSFDSAITVGINMTIPPNDSQETFGKAYGTGQVQWRYKYNNHIFVSQLIKSIDGDIPLIPIHASINTQSNIVDAVHPTETGYYQISDTVYSYLNAL